MIITCPACSDVYAIPPEHIAALVQVACPHCADRIILDFAAANDASLIEAGTRTTSGYLDEVQYRQAVGAPAPAAKSPHPIEPAPARPDAMEAPAANRPVPTSRPRVVPTPVPAPVEPAAAKPTPAPATTPAVGLRSPARSPIKPAPGSPDPADAKRTVIGQMPPRSDSPSTPAGGRGLPRTLVGSTPSRPSVASPAPSPAQPTQASSDGPSTSSSDVAAVPSEVSASPSRGWQPAIADGVSGPSSPQPKAPTGRRHATQLLTGMPAVLRDPGSQPQTVPLELTARVESEPPEPGAAVRGRTADEPPAALDQPSVDVATPIENVRTAPPRKPPHAPTVDDRPSTLPPVAAEPPERIVPHPAELSQSLPAEVEEKKSGVGAVTLLVVLLIVLVAIASGVAYIETGDPNPLGLLPR